MYIGAISRVKFRLKALREKKKRKGALFARLRKIYGLIREIAQRNPAVALTPLSLAPPPLLNPLIYNAYTRESSSAFRTLPASFSSVRGWPHNGPHMREQTQILAEPWIFMRHFRDRGKGGGDERMKNHRANPREALCGSTRSRGFIGNASSDCRRDVRSRGKATMYSRLRAEENAVISWKVKSMDEIDPEASSREKVQTTCRFWREIDMRFQRLFTTIFLCNLCKIFFLKLN